jgi:hypothetical protein
VRLNSGIDQETMYISHTQSVEVIHRVWPTVVAVLLLSLTGSWTPSTAQENAEGAALAFVTAHRIGSNLPQMALAVASRTQTFQILSKKLGPPEALRRVRDEIAAAAPKYQEQWDKNLASAYAKHFSAEEIESLNAEGSRSKYAGKLASMQRVVGDDMRAASQPMLTEMLKGVLSSVLSGVEN